MPPRIPLGLSQPSRTVVWSANGRDKTTLCLRTFSSTPTPHALGPQSPNYIEVPKPLQPTFPLEPHVKGHLPMPRDIFKTRNRHSKQSDVFLSRSTRPPKTLKAPSPHSRDAEYRLYKQRLAEKRRAALTEGVKQLHERKLAVEAQNKAQLRATFRERRAKAMAPPRDVDVLTQTSVSKGIRDFLGSQLPASSHASVISTRRLAYQRRLAHMQAVRTSRLHDLYVNAREFIIDEQQLDEAIEKTFGTEEAPIGWDIRGNMGLRSEGKEGLSAWNGPIPEGVSDMLQKLKGGEGVGLAKERVQKVAEALTGGKM